MRNQNIVVVISLALACIALSSEAQAISPAPDGCYPNFTVAEGCDALNSLTTGAGNTALGWRSLFLNTDGSFNTGVGGGALALNNGASNTAVGAAALLLNTTGTQNTAVGTDAMVLNDSGSANTATGVEALFSNFTGEGNTANGAYALDSNTTGNVNTAIGDQALFSNTIGNNNTASGFGALEFNMAGNNNTAIGVSALFSNTTAGDNAAIGYVALLSNTTGEFNVAIGSQALRDNVTGDSNTAVGDSAGFNITGSGNVCIGAGVNGVAGENNITRIRNVYESVATERAVYVTSDNRIGTLSSSRRYKEQIKPMENASEAIHSLRPVTFRYKKEVDSTRSLSFGLIAEEVATISEDLVTSDRDGKPATVRYEAINAMLLNEFLKEHRAFVEQQDEVKKLEATVAGLMTTVKEQAAQIQRVSAQLEVNKSATRTVAIDQ